MIRNIKFWDGTGDVFYIGRANKHYGQKESIFANPFIIGRDGDRATVIEKFRVYAENNQEILDNLHLIDGKDLLCYCGFPLEDCHGRVLLELRESQKLAAEERHTFNKVIVAGSRKLSNYAITEEAILESGFEINEIVCGCAKGPDTNGRIWAERHNIPVKKFPAKWDDFNVKPCVVRTRYDGARYNSWAGHIRNREMAEYGTHLILVWDGKSSGSSSMKKLAVERGLIIYEKIVPLPQS